MTETLSHHRHSIRLKEYDYSLNGVYFITICSREKKHLFGRVSGCKMCLSKVGQVVDVCWQSIPNHFPEVELGEYVVMPNHLHGIICIDAVGANHHSPLMKQEMIEVETVGANHHSPLKQRGTSMTIGSIIRGFKIGVTKQVGYSPWQRNYYEHIIRNQKSCEQIANYIVNNPMNWRMDCYFVEANDSLLGANSDLPLRTQQ